MQMYSSQNINGKHFPGAALQSNSEDLDLEKIIKTAKKNIQPDYARIKSHRKKGPKKATAKFL